MSTCRHTSWLRLLRKDHELVLEVSDRAKRLLDGLSDPDEQPASLVVLIGNRSKVLVGEKLGVGYARPGGKRAHGEIHLSAAAHSSSADKQVLVADGDIPAINRLWRSWKAQQCHEVTVRPLPQDSFPGTIVETADYVYYRLLLPFADVVCFFADDLGGIDRVVCRLAAWLDKGPASATEVRPWLLVVVGDGAEEELLASFWDLVSAETSIDVRGRFRGVRVVSLSAQRRGVGRRQRHAKGPWDGVRDEVLRASDLTQRARRGSSSLFSARHLAAFLQHAAENVPDTLRAPFDFIRASRVWNPVAPDLEMHLANFLSGFRSLEAIKDVAVPVVASSLILDQYPPGMHPFEPRHVFGVLYREACCRAASALCDQGSSRLILPSGFVRRVESEMAKQFRAYLLGKSSADLHRQVLARFRNEWTSLHSDDTCFCCIRRRPQFGLPCAHSVCENCVRVFGASSESGPWVSSVPVCFLCDRGTDGVRIRLKPDTASVRVLSFDGGGARALASLEFVRAMQAAVGLPYPVQQNFDVVYGTSSGAIIACALCINGWPVEDCIACFGLLARLAFRPRFWWLRSHFLFALCQLLLPLLVDSRYPAKKLETLLQKVFGARRSIMDCSKATETGANVGITVTTIQDASACIFTSYNAVGQRDGNTDYHALKPEGGVRRIPLWKILRCSTAAPAYFRPQDIEGLGTFQDGGLTFNNPASVALREAAVLFPDAAEPSLVVSLGTGSARAEGPRISKSRRLWRDSFPLRVFRAFWHHGSSKRAWQQLLSHRKAGRTGEFFRFDVEFEGSEPRLDDVAEMPEIARAAREAISGSPSLQRLARHIRAELFFFELDPSCPPRLAGGAYDCVGHILCRLQARTPEFEALMRRLDQSSATFQVGSRVLPGGLQDRSAALQDGSFRKEVRFHTATRQEPFVISLREGLADACNISGAPFTLQRLAKQQRLEAWFGTADHRKRRSGEDDAGRPRKRRRCQR